MISISSRSVFVKAFAALLMSLRVSATFRTVCPTFASAMMDPVVTPGRASAHLHEIAGTIGFADTIHEDWMSLNATTCDETADHSNYWVPAMYRTDLGPTPVKLTAILQPYYEFSANDVPYMDATGLANPLSMVTGNPHGGLASDNVWIEWSTRTPLRENGTVDSGRYGWVESASNVKEVMLVYRFPSCWNGMPYAADQSHVAFTDRRTNRCPGTHPRQFPRVRLEQRYIFDTVIAWTNFQAPFRFSSGDETTAHGDVVLFWDQAVLSELIRSCTSNTAGDCKAGPPRSSRVSTTATALTYKVPTQYADTGMPPM